MNDHFDDNCDDMGGHFDDHGDGGTDGDHLSDGSGGGFWDGPGWQDWMIIGPMSENIANEQREQDRLQKEWEEENDKDYWNNLDEPW
jgi:hypothetical protein